MPQKPKNLRGKRGAYTRVITRTTSESLRLVEPEKLNNNESHTSANLTLPPPQKPASSFVVTSVVHSRGDGGTDSPEDESRSDDISRVTDLETPSCSEETYSKEVDDEGASVSFTESAQPPVPLEGHTVVTIPSVLPSTHSQIESTVTSRTDIQSVSAVPQQIQSPEQEKPATIYGDNVFIAKCNRCIGRFQVVKVESIVPFHRGRWTCHDYLDNSKHAPEDGWVFYKERFVKKSELAQIKTLEEQNISTVITSTVNTITASQPPHSEVCQFKTYSTNIPDNSCTSVQSNVQQKTNYSTNQLQPAQASKYNISGQEFANYQPLQYQTSDQKYLPVISTGQQQIFVNESAITSPLIENAPNARFHPQAVLPMQPFVNQMEYYSGVPFSPQPLTSTHAMNVNENTLQSDENQLFLQGQNMFVNQQQQSMMTTKIATGTYSAPVQSQYHITPQNQIIMSQSEPPSAQGPSNPFVFPQVTQVPNQTLVQVPNLSAYLGSQGNLVQVNQNTRMMPARQYLPVQTVSNIIPSTMSYDYNILQNTPINQTTVMTTLATTSNVNSFAQTRPYYVGSDTSVLTSPPVYQIAGVNTVQGSPRNNDTLNIYSDQMAILNNMNQNILTTQAQNVHVPLQNVMNNQISTSEMKPMPMQFINLRENVPSILGQQVQGSVIQTPPQTPTSFPVQAMHSMPLQNLQVQPSVMNTPPQTPILDQPILQSTTVLPSQHSASIPTSGDSVWIHPFSSTPCILTNMCYQFLPIVAYPPVANSQFQRQRYNSTPTLSYSWPSSPTYSARVNENVAELSDNETKEILVHVTDYLNRQEQNQRGGSIEHQETSNLTPVDNKGNEQYVIVVEKGKTSSPLLTKETVAPPDLRKGSVMATPPGDLINNETPKTESKISIKSMIAKSDNESLVTKTENVIAIKSLVSSKDKANEGEENSITVASINSFTHVNTGSADICSISQNKTSNLVDSEDDPGIGVTRFCLENVSQKTTAFDKNKLQKKFEEKQMEDSKRQTIGALIDSETCRVIVMDDKKTKSYIPPFPNLKPGYTELSDSDSLTSRERILQSNEDVLSEHLEVASDSCDSQSDNTVISRGRLPLVSSLNDTKCDYSESNHLITEGIIEYVSPDDTTTPTQPESSKFIIYLMRNNSDNTLNIISPEHVSAAVSPLASIHSPVACSCLEQIHRVTSCASSVIDHKIEQAMDLVKTHLMNSMRAEVESLKARIAELMERIHQLELENDFLKANASPEVLTALNNGAARIQDTALSYDFMTPTTTQSATN